MAKAGSPSTHRGSLMGQLWAHLSARRRRQFKLVFALAGLSAFAEIASLGAIIPFIVALTQPERLFRWPFAAKILASVGIATAEQLLLPLTVVFVLVVLAANSVRMLLLWSSARVTFSSGADLSSEVYRRTLYQPYSVHVARNSSEVISGITSKVGGTVLGIMFPAMTLISSGVSLLATLVTLLAINPGLALGAGFGFAACYGAITFRSRRRLRQNSRRMAQEHDIVVKALQEGLGGIRDVLLDGSQPVYCEVYRRAEQSLRRAQGENAFIAQSPRYSMEALGVILIAGLAYYLSRQMSGVTAALPVLGALALGAQRLLPAMQQVYGAWASIAGSHALLEDTLKLLEQPIDPEASGPAPTPLPFEREVRLDRVCFRYTPQGPWVIDDLSLAIRKGARIGLVGGTGSGKSTTLDLIMGLLTPQGGSISIDDRRLEGGNVRAWQARIAHVPQFIFLADTTLEENIAFGVRPETIDRERVRQAAESAQIREFIESMPEGFAATVGERGVRLSGGQRQRIGIARALYKGASVLIFDEATSALDNSTERSVMDAIEGLSRELTIIMIAHRLTTIQWCDTIIELESGRLIAQGTYSELLASSESFRRMASAGRMNT